MLTRTGIVCAVIVGLGVSAAEAGEDKYLLVARNQAYLNMVSAEGYSESIHVGLILAGLLPYLSDRDRFWLTFNKGFKTRGWDSPAGDSPCDTFLSDLGAEVPTGNATSHALCVGLTGKKAADASVLGIAYVDGRHSVVFYRHTKARAEATGQSRFARTRATTGQEIGHNFGESGHHNTGDAEVKKSGSCSMDRDDTDKCVYRYCSNHVAAFHRYQKNKGDNW